MELATIWRVNNEQNINYRLREDKGQLCPQTGITTVYLDRGKRGVNGEVNGASAHIICSTTVAQACFGFSIQILQLRPLVFHEQLALLVSLRNAS